MMVPIPEREIGCVLLFPAGAGAVEIFYKDMGLAIELAREHGIELMTAIRRFPPFDQ